MRACKRLNTATAPFVAEKTRLVAFPKLWRGSGDYGGVNTRFPFALALALWLAAFARADESLLHARQAQALLGADVWSQVVRIENENRASVYPRRTHALVFEFAGILWFYHPANGTQSFSLHRDRLAAEKADFAPLMRDIEPGFVRWAQVARAESVAAPAPGKLPNGCFIESLVALRDRVEGGVAVEEPKLLSYFVAGGGVGGHTVLTYRAGGELKLVDSVHPGKVFAYPANLARDPVRLARAHEGTRVAKALLLPVTLPLPLSAAASAATAATAPAEESDLAAALVSG